MRKQEIDRQIKELERNQEIYQNNKEGRDQSEKSIMRGVVYMRKKYKTLAEDDSEFGEYEYILNNQNLYFMQKGGEGLRDIECGLNLIKIPMTNEKVKEG